MISHSRRSFLQKAALAALTVVAGCGERQAPSRPHPDTAPNPPTPSATSLITAAQKVQFDTFIDSLRQESSRDPEKKLLLSAYTDKEVQAFFIGIVSGTAEQKTILKNQFQSNPELGKKVFAILQHSLNTAIPLLGSAITKAQDTQHAIIRTLPAKIAAANASLAVLKIQSKTNTSIEMWRQQAAVEARVRDLTYELNVGARSDLMRYRVEKVTPLKVDGTYGIATENAMSTYSSRKVILTERFPHIKRDRRNDTSVGLIALKHLSTDNPAFGLFLRYDNEKLPSAGNNPQVK